MQEHLFIDCQEYQMQEHWNGGLHYTHSYVSRHKGTERVCLRSVFSNPDICTQNACDVQSTQYLLTNFGMTAAAANSSGGMPASEALAAGFAAQRQRSSQLLGSHAAEEPGPLAGHDHAGKEQTYPQKCEYCFLTLMVAAAFFCAILLDTMVRS